MTKTAFNDGWKCFRTGEKDEAFAVTIPHDAMLLDPKGANAPSGVNSGWYEAQDYTYEKKFTVPAAYEYQHVVLEFEGVYRRATVYINDREAAYEHYGYLGFLVRADEYLKYGEENSIRVEVLNSDQPNSRWYSGTGIYRPVWLHVLPKDYIEIRGVRIKTLDYKKPKIRIEVRTSAAGTVTAKILNGEEAVACVQGNTEGYYQATLPLPEAKLWSPEEPVLYTCKITYRSASGEEDVRAERFGIRVISCTRKQGFCINGERVILKGACIHHDNGLLGACAYDFAEKRKIHLLKENGYNAVRSAHNPCSRALLEACDELGMLVVDEYADMWYIHKTKYDYADRVRQHYREDLKCIVDKDYNHPSVIMYSTGNEVAETAQKEGIELCGNMTQYLHSMDDSRPVTCGINIFFNFLSSMGFGVYSDKKADRAVENARKKKAVGSEFFNKLSGIMGADFMKFGATLPPCDLKTRDAFARMDVAGYNYGIDRYAHDLKKYPERIILGTETFCADVCRFYEMAKKNTGIIGDFVWAGMDYLGETGIGAREYKDYAPRFDGGPGWVSAGAGRIDLTGKPLAEMAYMRVVYGLQKIAIGVMPVDHASDPHSPSAWKMTNAMESWSFHGCDGKKTQVEVYARAHHVALYVNQKCVGSKPVKNDCRTIFQVVYQSGEVSAKAFDEQNREIAGCSLSTAGDETVLTLVPEQSEVRVEDLLYVRMKYTDKKAVLKPLIRGDIKVEVKGGTLIGLGSACPYYVKSYLGDTADTYYGEAMAIIRPEKRGKIVVKAKSPYGGAEAEVEVV